MATYLTDDFADFGTDWTERYNTGGTWSVSSGDLTLNAGSANDWRCLSWNDIDSDADRDDVEILALITTPSSLATALYTVFARGSGADESATLFAFRIFSSTWRVDYCSGSDTPTSVASITATQNTSTDYWCRLRVNGSSPTSIKAKLWAASGSEPATWAIDTTTSSGPTNAGWVGAAMYSTPSMPIWKQIGVGTNGDTAPSSTGGTTTNITVTTAAVSITPTALTIQKNKSVSVTTAAVNITPTALTVVNTTNVEISVTPVTVSITPTNLSINKVKTVSVTTQAVTVTPTNLTINQQTTGVTNIIVTTPAVTIAKTNLSIKQIRNVSVTTASISVTPTNATIVKNSIVSVVPSYIEISPTDLTIEQTGPTTIIVTTPAITITPTNLTIINTGLVWTTVSRPTSIWSDVATASSIWTEV